VHPHDSEVVNVVSDRETNIQMSDSTDVQHSTPINQLTYFVHDPSHAVSLIIDDIVTDLDQELPMLFDEELSAVVVVGPNIVSRAKLIEMQRKDTSLARYFNSIAVPDANSVNFHILENHVLIRCTRDRSRPPGLEVTQIVVLVVLRHKLIGLAHDSSSSAHLGVQKQRIG